MTRQETWLRWVLYVATLAAAASLGLTVFIAPWIADAAEPSLWTLYADDLTVRRTSIFSALGLLVTALVFFKPKPAPVKEKKPDATTNVAGA